MSIPKFEFSKTWTNPADFPTIETDEIQVRADLQALHNETRDYFNATLLPQIDSEVEEMKTWVTEAVKDAALGQLPDASLTTEKLADGAVSTAKIADAAVTREKIADGTTLPNPKALCVGQQRYDGAEELALSSDGLPIDSASAQALGLGENATMNQALAALAPLLGSAQIATGSYAGSGGVGKNSPTVIDCGFVPKLVIVTIPTHAIGFYESAGKGVIWFDGVTASAWQINNGNDYILWTNFAVEGTKLKLWVSETHEGEVVPTLTADAQYNANGKTYAYLAIGVREGA